MTKQGGPFDSAWLKWGWATVRAQALQREVVDFEDKAGPEVEQRYDPASRSIVWYCIVPPPFPAARWGLMLGDAVSNYRACLDHLAWALVRRGSIETDESNVVRRDKRLKGVYFPIVTEETEFQSECRKKLPCALDDDLRVVERFQPFRRSKNDVQNDPLRWLAELSVSDKHRVLRLARMSPTGGEIRLGQEQDCEIRRVETRSMGTLMDVGAEVYRVRVKKTGPNPLIPADFRFSGELALSPEVWVSRWLKGVGQVTRKLLTLFAERPAEVLDLGLETYPSTNDFWL